MFLLYAEGAGSNVRNSELSATGQTGVVEPSSFVAPCQPPARKQRAHSLFMRWVPVFLAFTVQSCERTPNSHTSKPMNTELWWCYQAEYDGLIGSTTINLALKSRAPISDFPTLVMTGVSYESSHKRPELKLPEMEDLKFLNRVSEKRVALVTSHAKAIWVGAFLHDNQQVDYFYVADPAGLEDALREFHQKECPGRRIYFKSQDDPKWGAYLDFLYPNEATIEHYRGQLEKLGAL
jgi:hypothetical protein